MSMNKEHCTCDAIGVTRSIRKAIFDCEQELAQKIWEKFGITAVRELILHRHSYGLCPYHDAKLRKQLAYWSPDRPITLNEEVPQYTPGDSGLSQSKTDIPVFGQKPTGGRKGEGKMKKL